MKFRQKLFLSVFALSLFGGISAAEEPARTFPDGKKLACMLLEIAGTPETMEQTLQSMLNSQLQSEPGMLPYRHVLEAYLRRTISYDALKEELAGTYLEIYTQDELRALIHFYQTPIGRKKAAADAKIAVALAEITRRKMAEQLPQFQQQLQQEMQKRQLLLQSGQPAAGPELPSPAQP